MTAAQMTASPLDSYTLRPTTLLVEASSACQLRCPSCPTAQGQLKNTVGTGMLAPADLDRLLSDNPFVKHVELSNWGEIFLNPKFVEILALCSARGVTVGANNGVNLNTASAEMLEAVVRFGVRAVRVSLDGATQESYRKYRVKGNFDTVITNVCRINAYKKLYQSQFPELTWQFVAFGHNQDEIPAAKQLADSLGMGFDLKLSWDDKLSPLRDTAALRAAMPGGAISRADYRDGSGTQYLSGICNQLWDAPQINWDGRNLGCCRNIWGDFGGNAFRDGLIPTLNHDRMHYARAMLRGQVASRPDIPCTRCEHYQQMQQTGRYLARDNISSGQILSIEEALAMAKLWLGQGLADKTAHICTLVLASAPNNPAAQALLAQARLSATA